MAHLRRILFAMLIVSVALCAASAVAQRTQFDTPVNTAPTFGPTTTAPAPPPGTTYPPPATFSGPIQPVSPAMDPYNPSLQPIQPYQPGAAAPQTAPGDGYLFTRPDGSLGEWPRFLQQARFRYTWIDGNGTNPNSLGMNIAEIDGTFVLPFLYNQNAPLLVTPGFSADWTQGPQSGVVGPDLPPQLFEAYIDLGWRPHITDRFGADLGFRTGIYSDFSYLNSKSFRYIGRGYGTYTFSPRLEIKAGVVYIDRLNVKLLPAGGIIWTPDPDTRFEVLFPNPKLAIRLTTIGNVDVWGYVAGEYGGDSWTITREPSEVHDQVEYDDLKIVGGVEWTGRLSIRGFVEGGYVFDRKLDYRSNVGNIDPQNTIMVRGGIAF